MDRKSDDVVRDALREFLEDEMIEDIQLVADHYPDEQSIEVDYVDLLNYFQDSGHHTNSSLNISYITQYPEQCFEQAERAIQKEILSKPQKEKGIEIHLRIHNLRGGRQRAVRELRAEDLGDLVSVKGLVRKASKVRPRISQAMYKCLRCGTTQKERQNPDTDELNTPLTCQGCDKSSNKTDFLLLRDESDFDNYQTVELQESPEELRGGKRPERIEARLKHDLVSEVVPGDRVTFNGILKNKPRGTTTKMSKVFDIYLEVRSIEVEEHEFEKLDIEEEDKKKIESMAERPNIFERITDSIAPSIRGLKMEKRGLALQLFGGVRKTMKDGIITRGDIHVLFVGDPGTGKSQLLRYVSSLAPRGMFASGKGTTGAGLTAAAVKEKVMGEAQWVLEAGTLVLADGGIACIDELDKMDKNDRSAMHEAMEQQKISVAKAGINTTLNSRCSILGAANPELGRFEIHQNVSQQIDLPPPLISRFDLIFALIDQPNKKKDSHIAEHILDIHIEGEKRESNELDESSGGSYTLSKDFLKKYISYAKRINPIMTDPARKKLEDFYVDLRDTGNDESSAIPVTARQLESLVRLSEASARAHLRNQVILEDAERAIEVTNHFLEQVVATDAGELDIDMVSSKLSKNDRVLLKDIRDIIREKTSEDEESSKRGVSEEIILDNAEQLGYSRYETEEELERMREHGELYSPEPGRFRLT